MRAAIEVGTAMPARSNACSSRPAYCCGERSSTAISSKRTPEAASFRMRQTDDFPRIRALRPAPTTTRASPVRVRALSAAVRRRDDRWSRVIWGSRESSTSSMARPAWTIARFRGGVARGQRDQRAAAPATTSFRRNVDVIAESNGASSSTTGRPAHSFFASVQPRARRPEEPRRDRWRPRRRAACRRARASPARSAPLRGRCVGSFKIRTSCTRNSVSVATSARGKPGVLLTPASSTTARRPSARRTPRGSRALRIRAS